MTDKRKDQEKRIRVKRVDEQPAPEQVRRIGRALIALARLQLEADAQAQHEQKTGGGEPGGSSSGDAA